MQVDISEFIDRRKVGRYQVFIFCLCAAVVLLDGFDALAMGYVAPSIITAWGASKASLGPVFAASQIGIMIGALLCGPMADRFGRKPVLVASVMVFGLFALLTAACAAVPQLLVVRLLAGLGMGGAMPNAVALTSEFAPQRKRATIVMMMFSGFTFGGAFGGFLASSLVSRFGWQSVFVVGGVIPIALAIFLAFALPESIRFMVLRAKQERRVTAILSRIDRFFVADDQIFYRLPEQRAASVPLAELFKGGRMQITLLLWIMFFMSLFELFFIANWLPTILRGQGYSIKDSLLVTSVYQIGGTVGTLLLGRFVDSHSPYKVVSLTYVVAAILICGIGILVSGSFATVAAVAAAAGFFSIGAQIATNALAADAYPTAMRVTGIGWALGIGRIGAIVSSLISGMLISMQTQAFQIFLIGAIPIFVAGLAAALIGRRISNGVRVRATV